MTMDIQSILGEWLVAILVAIVVIVTLVLLRLGVLDKIFGSPKGKEKEKEKKLEEEEKEDIKRWRALYRKHLRRRSMSGKKLSAYERVRKKYAERKKHSGEQAQ